MISVSSRSKSDARLVIIESPFAADTLQARNQHIDYARQCVADSLARSECPLASHLLYTQPGILDDSIPEQRAKGLAAGLAWYSVADAAVFYVDYGMSPGMQSAFDHAKRVRLRILVRRIYPKPYPAYQNNRKEG